MTTQLPSKERLEAIAALMDITLPDGTTITANAYGVAGSHDIALMARALLSAYEQEPVGIVRYVDIGLGEKSGVHVSLYSPLPEGAELFTHAAPSIPAAVPEDFEAWAKDAGLIHESFGLRSANSNIDVARKAYEAGRAVMQPDGRDYRAIVERIAEIMHGSVTDVDLLTVTVLSMKQKSDRTDWISVSERLPKPNTYVQVSNGAWVGLGAYNDSEHLDDDEHWQDEHHEFINLLHHPVTHWQPLPALPKV